MSRSETQEVIALKYFRTLVHYMESIVVVLSENANV